MRTLVLSAAATAMLCATVMCWPDETVRMGRDGKEDGRTSPRVLLPKVETPSSTLIPRREGMQTEPTLLDMNKKYLPVSTPSPLPQSSASKSLFDSDTMPSPINMAGAHSGVSPLKPIRSNKDGEGDGGRE
mmetsp:Transcript_16559/g.35978  ORF Transcript_16559/g.35978 Transcript_16559/m.35978 type:complete len:131 (-) Transcript_16559:528-920(-)